MATNESYGFYGITRSCQGDESVSSLEWSSKHPTTLTIIGNLPHGAKVAPRSTEEAEQMIDWLEGWIARKTLPTT